MSFIVKLYRIGVKRWLNVKQTGDQEGNRVEGNTEKVSGKAVVS
ncbi:hypothetical protein PHOSAC3_120252 [Mesotoga infera]|nr:hypothetical protein PHOSAC3_120252 [Mesotoga infera]